MTTNTPNNVARPGKPDLHSHSNFDRVRVKHLRLDVSVDMENERLDVVTSLRFRRMPGCPQGEPLILDSKALDIRKVSAIGRNGKATEAQFTLGEADEIFGSALTISLPAGVNEVRIEYSTTKDCQALQWLPERPGRKGKFLFSQGQAILTRSWIPLQDCPAVRITYEAVVNVPKGMKAVMSAAHRPTRQPDTFSFSMNQKIPPYLLALTVGDLAFRSLGRRTGVYAEPDMIEKAAWEFAEVESMLEAAEKLYGRYRWGRWDLLVLPSSFPFGGMENPRLTFVTPTLLAGDRSLVSVVVHELAHSWFGNLVTNASAADFWLNEGFTVYAERRILEALYGKERADMEQLLGLEELKDLLSELAPGDQILHIDLAGRDPDDGCNEVPYEKGALFLRTLEEAFGRKQFDRFLRGYSSRFAFRSIVTAQFRTYLAEKLLKTNADAASGIDIETWLNKPGLPERYAATTSSKLAAVDTVAQSWETGAVTAPQLQTSGWGTHEWLRFLQVLPQLSPEKMSELDAVFHFTAATNAEILFQWLMLSIKSKYSAADGRLESFLLQVGRRKYALPLYQELSGSLEGKERARQLFECNRGGYHPLLIESVKKLFQQTEAPAA